MSKVVGKNLELWIGGEEIPVNQSSLSEAFDTLESTDTSTPLSGKDHEIARATRSVTFEGILYGADGAEIATGNLTAGTRYRVSDGSIVETQGTFTVGMLFESDGTGVATSVNTVVPLGAKLTGKNINFNFNSIAVPVTSVDVSIKFDELDGTDSATTGDATETLVSRADRETKLSLIMRSDVADLLTTAPVAQACVLTFATGATLTGKAIPISKSIVDEVSGFVKVEYSFKWVGCPAEVGLGLPAAVEKSVKMVAQRGTTTHKEYTGNAIITGKTISSDVKGLVKVSYTMKVNGALTYAVAN